MANNVFANNNEVACKAASGKTIAALPDTCFTPPECPATPPGVPIPYPNTGMASDTIKGSKTVKISDKEVGLKNKSYFKTSYGDEAGCATKKGIITSKNKGKVYFQSWSSDVKFEGKNAVRHLDMTTNNHASGPGDTPPWPYVDSMTMSTEHPCVEDQIKEMMACQDYKPNGEKDACAEAKLGEKPGRKYDTEMALPSGIAKDNVDALWDADRASANDCIAARRCELQPYDSKKTGCCPGQTPHHLVEASSFFKAGVGNGRGGKEKGVASIALNGIDVTSDDGYKEGDAPCVCAEGPTQNVGTHGIMHTLQSTKNMEITATSSMDYDGGSTASNVRKTTYKDAKGNATEAMATAFPNANCNPECIEKQLDN